MNTLNYRRYGVSRFKVLTKRFGLNDLLAMPVQEARAWAQELYKAKPELKEKLKKDLSELVAGYYFTDADLKLMTVAQYLLRVPLALEDDDALNPFAEYFISSDRDVETMIGFSKAAIDASRPEPKTTIGFQMRDFYEHLFLGIPICTQARYRTRYIVLMAHHPYFLRMLYRVLCPEDRLILVRDALCYIDAEQESTYETPFTDDLVQLICNDDDTTALDQAIDILMGLDWEISVPSKFSAAALQKISKTLRSIFNKHATDVFVRALQRYYATLENWNSRVIYRTFIGQDPVSPKWKSENPLTWFFGPACDPSDCGAGCQSRDTTHYCPAAGGSIMYEFAKKSEGLADTMIAMFWSRDYIGATLSSMLEDLAYDYSEKAWPRVALSNLVYPKGAKNEGPDEFYAYFGCYLMSAHVRTTMLLAHAKGERYDPLRSLAGLLEPLVMLLRGVEYDDDKEQVNQMMRRTAHLFPEYMRYSWRTLAHVSEPVYPESFFVLRFLEEYLLNNFDKMQEILYGKDWNEDSRPREQEVVLEHLNQEYLPWLKERQDLTEIAAETVKEAVWTQG